MTTNSYFSSNYFGAGEQALYTDLIIESIQQMGYDVHYIPRSYVALDKLYGEDVQSAFNTSYVVEMYHENVLGYEGQGDLMAKFGLEIRDEMKLVVARQRFAEEIIANEPAYLRPKEGDLIYVPIMRGNLFEITFVEDEAVFYQIGKLYTYTITMKRFEMSGETFNTGIAQIDAVETDVGYTEELSFDSGFGDYEVGESVFQGNNLASATYKGRVNAWNPTTKKLIVGRTFGILKKTDLVNGETSGATYSITELTTETVVKNKNDTRTDNKQLIKNPNNTIDETIKNPLTDY